MIINRMIDFEGLVTECILNEALALAPFSEYFKTPTELSNIRTDFNAKFGITTWPQPTTLFPILQDAFVRTRAEALIPFADQFPLIDFVWYVAEKEGADVLDLSGVNIEQAVMTGHASNFKVACDTNNPGTNLHPLFGYVPSSAKATAYQRPLQKKISNTQIGRMNLAQFDNFSIKKALYGILEIRKKIRQSVIKNKQIPDSIKWVDSILNKPEMYSGRIQIPNEFKVLYDRVSAQQLIEIADTLHDFFESEKASAEASRGATLSTAPNAIENTFMHFISNQNVAPGANYAFTTRATPTGFESPNLSGMKGGYIIKNIKKINTPQAKEVVNELTKLANFINEGEPTTRTEKISKLLSGATEIAKGLSLGVPTMGR